MRFGTGIFGLAGGLAALIMLAGAPAAAQTAAPAGSEAGSSATPAAPQPDEAVNIYRETAEGRFSPAVAGALSRVYVPNIGSGDVFVIDPETREIVDRYKVGRDPQHVVPSWDLRTLWVAGSTQRRSTGSLTPIDPVTGKPGETIIVPDAYNMYFMPDGSAAIVVAEAERRLEFRDPQTMALRDQLVISECVGLNHADFTADGKYAVFTCEFRGSVVKIDMAAKKVLGLLKLSRGGMPQDIRLSPDGKNFFVADMHADGVHVIDAEKFVETGFIPTGIGAHGITPSRDGRKFFIANRGTHSVRGTRKGPGSVSVLDIATQTVEATWPIPGGGSPDMGNLTADGKTLWLTGRFDDVVYAIDTAKGTVQTIPVGHVPHGLTVWPQPGRYSLGHTGNMR